LRRSNKEIPMLNDPQGLALPALAPAASAALANALTAFRTYRGDPIAPLDEAIRLAPGLAIAPIAKALVLVTLFERRFARDALKTLDAAAPALARAGARERALAAAARRLAEGDWHGGVAALDQVLMDHPRDLLAIQAAHIVDFVRGDSLNLRNRISRVLPHWSPSVPGYSFVLGMHAFGLEECNQYPEAEATGLRALEMAPEDCWAVHAVTHVYEMQGRTEEGARFLQQRKADWATPDNGFAFHNWWHLALFHLDRGDHAAALAIYDEVLAGAHGMALSRIDATAMLWRLKLEGVDVGARFEAVADAWQHDLDAEAGFYAFNDFHAALAFAATGRDAPAARLRQAVQDATRRSDANAAMAREVGIGLCEAIHDFAVGRYGPAAEWLAAARDGAVRFGGSHAQRDLLTLTLIEAARLAGRGKLARHYLGERLVHKPGGAWGLRLAKRIGTAGPSETYRLEGNARAERAALAKV
jgi:tetratricopeptide (TPR) repeat protein